MRLQSHYCDKHWYFEELMGTNDQIQNEASHILYTECRFILVVGHNPEWIGVAKRALERHAQYIH